MTLHEITLLHAFGSWATQRVFVALEALRPDQLDLDMKVGHTSIFGTLFHLVDAEKIWLSRWNGTPEEHLQAKAIGTSLSALKTAWEKVGFERAKWLGTMTDKKLQETFTMTSQGNKYTHTHWQAIQHMTDHGTYHRAQISAMLRQLGFTPPVTSLITFYRETSKLKP
jgi:uncharacterized damage-inducible protein DinB